MSPRFVLPVLSAVPGRAPRACRADDATFEPTYPSIRYVPKVGSRWNHRLFARDIERVVQRLRSQFPFDVILCAWMYPDGCGVRRLAAVNGWPFVLVATGSDVHTYLHYPVRRRLIVDAANASCGVITRSIDLASRLAAAGARREKLHPVHNGVDTAVFASGDAEAARMALGLPADAWVLLFVGNLLPVKNPLLLVAARA